MLAREQFISGKEQQIEGLQKRTIAALEQKSPIAITREDALGDRIIMVGAARYVLGKLCDARGIPIHNIHLVERMYQVPGERTVVLGVETETIAGPLADHANAHMFQGEIERLASALGVALPPDYQKQVPLLARTDVPPFTKYDTELVDQEIARLTDFLTTNGKTLYILVQTGSIEQKRLNDLQMREVALAIKETYPNGYLVAMSDRNFQAGMQNQQVPVYADVVDEVFVANDMNKRIAYGAVCEEAYSTDSAGAWILAAGMAYRHTPVGELPLHKLHILYTLGTKEKHAIPGADIVESDALEHYREEFGGQPSLDFLTRAGPLNPGDYEQFFYLKENPGATAESFFYSDYSLPQIAESDVRKFIHHIRSAS